MTTSIISEITLLKVTKLVRTIDYSRTEFPRDVFIGPFFPKLKIIDKNVLEYRFFYNMLFKIKIIIDF